LKKNWRHFKEYFKNIPPKVAPKQVGAACFIPFAPFGTPSCSSGGGHVTSKVSNLLKVPRLPLSYAPSCLPTMQPSSKLKVDGST